MSITDGRIDGGKTFDWGRTSADYARYRDIYPSEFYKKIIGRGMCINGQHVLDLGTGTGVLPRNMYIYGAQWVGADISKEQIEQAKILSEGMNIEYFVSPSEQLDFPESGFDVVTACQCFWYFDHERLIPLLKKILKPGGKLLVLYMAWLPYEDEIAGKSEQLVLKYSPGWTGAGETVKPIIIPECYNGVFDRTYHDEYRLKVHFTRESWHGRMRACRGVGASLTEDEIRSWESEHLNMLENYPPEFDVIHYAAMSELTLKATPHN